MPVSFSNSSKVRNLHLNGLAENYAVPTKTENGPSLVSNSRVQENYKVNPNNYAWSSNLSYANTFNAEKNSSATKKFLKNAPGKYGNGWVNAVTLKQTYNGEQAERNTTYKGKISAIMRKFTTAKAPVKLVLAKGLAALAELQNTKKGANPKFEKVLSELVANTGVSKDLIMRNYPAFLEVYSQKKLMNNASKKTLKQGLNGLVKSKKNANNSLKQRNRNTMKLRASYAPNNNGGLSAPAELLSLSAKYGKPANFKALYENSGLR
jgi:hypothetical protein